MDDKYFVLPNFRFLHTLNDLLSQFMRKIAVTLALVAFCIAAHPQQKTIDSLIAKVSSSKDIKQKRSLWKQIHYLPGGDLALLKHGRKELERAKLSTEVQSQLSALLDICLASELLNDPPTLLDAALQGIRICQNTRSDQYLPDFLIFASFAYILERDIRHSINYSLYAAKLLAAKNDIQRTISRYSNLETGYTELKMPDSARYFARRELSLANQLKGPDKWQGLYAAYTDMGEELMNTGRTDSALFYYYRVIDVAGQHLHTHIDGYSENNIAKAYMQIGKPDSAIKYASDAYGQLSKEKRWDYLVVSADVLAKLYESRDPKKSIFYLKAQLATQDSLTANDRIKQLQLVGDKDQQREQELEAQQEKFNSRIRLYVVIGAATVLLVIGLILWRNNRRQKQINELLGEQKEEIEAQRDHLESALEKLKTTQTQLIQSEKMASLGELTAGIAHEIQNPLNFVNNFSEVSAELVDEMDEELDKGNVAEAKAISADIKQNLEKIMHHGKRADGIVKGMLEHSRTSTGQKEPTDLNTLADEYLRLAYHGLRAKDKDFNAELITRFDEKLPKINVVPQDIGRVLLNVINNAFYATQQKAKTAAPGYKPKVEISTLQQSGSAIVSVKDNGDGIPEAIKHKIMQPFFTTKPTGEGTGLGLSLSHDIVVKGHGGKIDIDTKGSEFTEFTITLPL